MAQVKKSGFSADLANLLTFHKIWREPSRPEPSNRMPQRYHVRVVSEPCGDPNCKVRKHFNVIQTGEDNE